jgi:hypothetical protein
MFGRETLLTFANQSQLRLKESQLPNALSEWLFFGTYVVRQGVASRCTEDQLLRDAILNEFFALLYAGLQTAGVKQSELTHLEHCIKARFQEYDRAQLESQGNPAYGLGLAVSTLMFGETPDAAMFAMLPALQFADSLESIKKLFHDFKVTH